MKKIIIGIMLAVMLSSFAFALTKGTPTPEQQFCTDNGHSLKCKTYSFGTYCWCADNYANECPASSYYSGNCRLIEDTKQDIKDYKLLIKLSEKDLTRCSKDNQCSLIETGKCHNGCRISSVNNKGVLYQELWNYFYTAGQYYCTMEICPISREAYCNKLTKTCELR